MSSKELQKAILRYLADRPGTRVAGSELNTLATPNEVETEVEYLKELGLLTAETYVSDGVAFAKITAKGRDFIDAHAGVGTDLKVITVRLHEDSIRALLISRVQSSDADETVKGKLIDQIKSLPSEGVSKLAEKALEKALQQMPALVQWLQTQPWN